MMRSSLSSETLISYVCAQMAHFFPDGAALDLASLRRGVDSALAWYERCCEGVRRKYYNENGAAVFNHLNTDQYAMFLYMLARSLHLQGEDDLAAKAYYLNKALHALDVYFTVELPEKFMFSHCVGTVLGKAAYGNYFHVSQNCTVGNNNNDYPVIGECVSLYAGAMVVGKCKIGNNVHVAAHAFVRNQDVPDNTLVTGRSPDLRFRPAKIAVRDNFF